MSQLTKLLAITFFLILIPIFSIGQEKSNLSEDQFRSDFLSAINNQDTEKTEKLILSNENNAKDFAEYLRKQANEDYKDSNYLSSIKNLDLALVIYREIGDKKNESDVLNNIGHSYFQNGTFEEAMNYYNQSIESAEIAQDIHGKSTTISNIGFLHLIQNNNEEAITSFITSLKLLEEDEIEEINPYLLINTFNGIGEAFQKVGDFDQAYTGYRLSLEIAKEIQDYYSMIEGMNNLSNVILNQEGYRIVISLSKLVQVLVNLLDTDDLELELCKSLILSGASYAAIGEHDEAIGTLNQALKLAKTYQYKIIEAQISSQLGDLYESIDNNKALKYIHHSNKILQEKNIEEYKSIQINNHLLTAKIYSESRKKHEAKNSINIAKKLINEIEDTNKEIMSKSLAVYYALISYVYLRINEFDNAHKSLVYASDLIDKEEDTVSKAMLSSYWGFYYEKQSNFEEALHSYKQSIAIFDKIINDKLIREDRENFSATILPLYARTIGLLIKMGKDEEAFNLSERARAKSFLELLHESSHRKKDEVFDEMIESKDLFREELLKISKSSKSIDTPDKIENIDLTTTLADLMILQGEASESIIKILADEDIKSDPITLGNLQANILGENDLLIEYFQGDEELFAFIISKNMILTHSLDYSTEDERTEKLVEQITKIPVDEFNFDLSHDLYLTLFKPLEYKIEQAMQNEAVKNLVIIPDGQLFYLPFEMLTTEPGKDSSFLVDKYNISYASSASVIEPGLIQNTNLENYQNDFLALAPFANERNNNTSSTSNNEVIRKPGNTTKNRKKIKQTENLENTGLNKQEHLETLKREYSNERPKIVAIEIEGVINSEESEVRKVIKTKVGQEVFKGTISEDIKRIYKLSLFNDIKVLTNNTYDGLVIKYILKENPVIDGISISGNKVIKDEAILKVIPIEYGQILPTNFQDKIINDIKNIYLKYGFVDVRVESSIQELSKDNKKIVLNIDEGKPNFIKGVRFIGNEMLEDSIIQDALYSLISKPYNPIEINKDIERIRTVYLDRGFLDVKVSPPEIKRSDPDEGYILTFRVEEGEGQTKINEITFSGDLMVPQEVLSEIVTLKSGEIFSVGVLADNILKLTTYYGNNGYATADVNPDIILNRDDLTIDIKFQINKGQIYKIGKITFQPDIDLKDEKLIDFLELKTGDVFSNKLIETDAETIENFYEERGFSFAYTEHSFEVNKNSQIVNVIYKTDLYNTEGTTTILKLIDILDKIERTPKDPSKEDILPVVNTKIQSKLKKMKPLPYSGKEVKDISNIFKNTSIYKLSENANMKFLNENLQDNKYIHFATHGYINSYQPMYSGLELNDDILETHEIFNLRINSDMVVLSACETGLGKYKAGEGIIGLSRAFMYAGTPTVVVSLWKVSDPSTAELMKQFYGNLKKGMSKSKALTEAKRWMIKVSYHINEEGRVTTHNHPFYWAPFILVGAYE